MSESCVSSGRDFLHCNPETVAANRNLNFPDTPTTSMVKPTSVDDEVEAAADEATTNSKSMPSKHLSEGQLGIFCVDLALMR